MSETIQILELFGGIGSPRCALRTVEEIYTGGLAKVTLNLRGGGQSINFTECKG